MAVAYFFLEVIEISCNRNSSNSNRIQRNGFLSNSAVTRRGNQEIYNIAECYRFVETIYRIHEAYNNSSKRLQDQHKILKTY